MKLTEAPQIGRMRLSVYIRKVGSMTRNITHYTLADSREVPAEDGAFATTEIARFPPDLSSPKPYLWRLTLAKRESSGSFVKFPGYERQILQISGKTITLRHTKHGEQKLSPLVPYLFKGEWETNRGLVGKAEDLNLFVRSESLKSKITRIDLKDRKPLSKSLSLHTILWAYQGAVEWECGEDKRVLKEGDTLALDSNEPGEFILKSKRALCFLISIEAKY